jgi:hypothetical protein
MRYKIHRHPEYTIMGRFECERGQRSFGEVDPDLLSLYGYICPWALSGETACIDHDDWCACPVRT